MTLKTRKPTGLPPWPITLIAGGEKAGKSYACAQASSSDLIGRTFWLGVGEDDPDELGALPGARFEIVQHDGTYRAILTQLQAAVATPPTEGKPNLIVLDSATRLWELLSDEAQVSANARRKNNSDTDSPISMDLWNKATDRWNKVMDLLREHQGPSLITARMDVVTVLDENGKPTKEKTTKIKAQKSLPYDVGVIVEMPTRGDTYISGARSLKLNLPVGEKAELPDFTMDELWKRLGVAEKAGTAPREHSGVDAKTSVHDMSPADAARKRLRAWLDSEGIDPAEAISRFDSDYDEPLTTTDSVERIDTMHTQWRQELGRAKGADKVHEGTLV